jgi:hypothetical protein
MFQLETFVFQISVQEVLEHVGPEIADMSVVIDCRTAGIKLYLVGIDRFERLERS